MPVISLPRNNSGQLLTHTCRISPSSVHVISTNLAGDIPVATYELKGKGKRLDTCYTATYMSGLVTSSALQSRKWQLIEMS